MPRRAQTGEDILDLIRQRQGLPAKTRNYDNNLEKIKENPLSQKDWYEFSKKYIDEFGGSKINPDTGLSHKEFLDYLKDSKSIFGGTHGFSPNITSTKKLKEFLDKLGEDPVKFDDRAKKLFKGLKR